MAAGKSVSVTLDRILALTGDIPAEGMLNVLSRAVNKARNNQLDISSSQGEQERVTSLYARFQSNEEVENVFSYLFVKVYSRAQAEESYRKLIGFLQAREGYGMAGDMAMEAHAFGLCNEPPFQLRAHLLYDMQIKQMDGQRSREGGTNEDYYDEMLHKAGRMDEIKARKEMTLRYWLGRGELGAASKICAELGKTADAERYRKLDELLKVS